MQKALLESLRKLISDKKVDVSQERFQWFLDSVIENIEISREVKNEFFIAHCERLLQEFLDCIIPFHGNPSNSIDVGKSTDSAQKKLEGFVPTNPWTWCALRTFAPTHSETELEYELSLEKALHKKLHPQDVLAFVPKSVKLTSRFSMQNGLEDAIVSIATLGFRKSEDAENPVLVSNLPFVTIFQDVEADMLLKASHVKKYLDIFLDFSFDESLTSEIVKARSCSNFLESPLAPDASFSAPEVFQIQISEDNSLDTQQSSIKNNDTGEELLTNNLKAPYLLTQYLLHEKETLESKVLFGLTHSGTMLIALESCWQYVQLMHYNSEGYYNQISKDFPVPQEVHNYFMLKIKQALLKLLYTSQEDLPESLRGQYSIPEMNDLPDDFAQMSKFPGQEAFLQNEGINMLFDKAFIATLGQILGRAFSMLLEKAFEECLISGNPQELGEEGLSPSNYTHQFIEGYMKPENWHSSRTILASRVVGLSLLDLDPKYLIRSVACLYENSLYPSDGFSSVYLREDASFLNFAFEMYVREENLFQHRLRDAMYNVYMLVNNMEPDEEESNRDEALEKNALRKALNNLGIDPEILCKSDPENETTRETYLSKLLSLVVMDIFAITPIRTIPSVFAKNLSNKVLYRSLVANTPYKDNAAFYTFLKEETSKNKKEIIAGISTPYKDIFQLGFIGFVHCFSDVLKPFELTNSAVSYLDLLHAIAQATTSSTSRDYILLKNILEISGLSLNLVEFLNYLTDQVAGVSRGLREALSFFGKFENYIDEHFDSTCLKYSDFKNNIIPKADFEKLQKEIKDFSDNKKNIGKGIEFELLLAPIYDLLVDVTEKIIFHTETSLVSGNPEVLPLLPDPDPEVILKNYFFDTEVPDLNPKEIAQSACTIVKIIFEWRNIDRSDRSPACIQKDLSEVEKQMLPNEIVFENILHKLDQWPFGDSDLLDQRLSLLYAVVFLHEISVSTQFAVIDSLLV